MPPSSDPAPPWALPDGTTIEDFVAAGTAAWPALRVDRAAFEEHLRVLAEKGPPELKHAADLYLACACALGVEGALAAFEARFGGVLAGALSRVDASAEFVDEMTQTIRIKLFAQKPAKIATYGGRAKLSTWLTTLAMRSALDERGSRRPLEESSSLLEQLGAAVNPELDFIRARYKAELEGAVEAALARLTRRDRGLLRLHLGERMSIDGLATAYGVGRSTAARWLASAKESLVEETVREVKARIRGTTAEIREVCEALRSQLDVSLVRLLASVGG